MAAAARWTRPKNRLPARARMIGQIFLPSHVNGPPGLLFISLPAALVLTFHKKSISL